MTSHILLIGANGGIASALIEEYLADESVETLVTVSRGDLASQAPKHEHFTLDSSEEESVKAFVNEQKSKQLFTHIICCTGVLHTSGDKSLKPEKRLEDISPEQLLEYFKVNTIVPAMWLKYGVKLANKSHCVITLFSARVASISENKLGGWYGYRSSKAALNMMLKTAAVEYKRRSPNTVLVCYHPGTVDTDLSKPFQGNVKPEKLFTPKFTAQQLIKHTTDLDAEHSPFYLDWDGQTIQW